MTQTARMTLVEALEEFRRWRQDQIVVTTMGAAREWPKLSQHALDFHFVPSAMGQAPALGLGLALAQPEREVVVFNGDGCMLMNLGTLVTVATCSPANYTLIVVENGVYEVTGGQKTAAAAGRVDLVAAAAACGFRTTFRFQTLSQWREQGPALAQAPGPRFVALEVAPDLEHFHLDPPGPIGPRIERFRQALGLAGK